MNENPQTLQPASLEVWVLDLCGKLCLRSVVDLNTDHKSRFLSTLGLLAQYRFCRHFNIFSQIGRRLRVRMW